MGHRLPSQDPTARTAGVEACGGVKDNGLRMAIGCCSRVVDNSFFLASSRGDSEPLSQVVSLCVLDGVPLALVGALEVS